MDARADRLADRMLSSRHLARHIAAAAESASPCDTGSPGASPQRANRSARMGKITYEIVRHDGGWAYRVDETFSETFPPHDSARKAAERAAREQAEPGEAMIISYEDKKGHWHDERSAGDERRVSQGKGYHEL